MRSRTKAPANMTISMLRIPIEELYTRWVFAEIEG